MEFHLYPRKLAVLLYQEDDADVRSLLPIYRYSTAQPEKEIFIPPLSPLVRFKK
jgi:hypothetical protein